MSDSFLAHRRLVFFGTPSTSARILERLCHEGFDVGLVVTRPDKRRGRGGALIPSAVKQIAMSRSIPVSDDLDDVMSLTPGGWLGVVVAYGRIIPQRILDHVPMINVHYSLLPRWRGAAPVERAILAGDRETGVCIMDLVAELDAGDVRARSSVPILQQTSAELLEELTDCGADLLADVLRQPAGRAEPQHGEITYARKIEPEELVIDWSQSSLQIWRQVRALRTHTTVAGGRHDGQRLGVHTVEPVAPDGGTDRDAVPIGVCDRQGVVRCGDGFLRLVTVQPEGKKAMPAADWLRGIQGETAISFRTH